MNKIIDHKHTWKRSPRRHGRSDRIFIVCADPKCGQVMQSPDDHLKPYTTGVSRGGKTIIVPFRLDPARFQKLRRNGIDVRKVMENFIDSF
jgi:hypothetical protein